MLIATDIAAKGLDFPDIQHVINFDMPDEIENYVHRIGRTGRCGKTGVATTFINKASVLCDNCCKYFGVRIMFFQLKWKMLHGRVSIYFGGGVTFVTSRTVIHVV